MCKKNTVEYHLQRQFSFRKLVIKYSVGRVSACLVSYCEQRQDRSWFGAPPGPCLLGKNSSAAMLATKRSVGVTPEMNIREHVTCIPLPSVNKAAHCGFETQRRLHQKSKTGASVAQQKRTYLLQILGFF